MIRYLLHLLAVGAHVCISEEINCSTLETSNGTFYIVPYFTGSDCHCSWINSSGHVLANDGGRIDKLIISSNSTLLHTFSCYETIEYSRDCTSTMYTTAKCYVNCTKNTALPRVPENTPEWLVPIIVSILSVILVILCFVCGHRLYRWRQHRYIAGNPINQNQVGGVQLV